MENTKTKFHPTLFSTPMVQALIEGRKTMTRRTKGLEKFNEAPDEWRYDGYDEPSEIHYMEQVTSDGKLMKKWFEVNCPYKVGDILWVRETFFDATGFKDNQLFQENSGKHIYKADETFIGCHKWKPSIFMPKTACRIFIKVKAVRVERLLDISKEDAIAEGIEFKKIDYSIEYKNYVSKSKEFTPFNDFSFPGTPECSFFSLWESINGKDNLEQNPFVFVYEFEIIEKPLDFLV